MALLQNQTFDCVLKALRIGRQARRTSWMDEGTMIYMRKGQLWVLTDTSKYPEQILTLPVTDILASDWEVSLI